jgi:hypothetical protein
MSMVRTFIARDSVQAHFVRGLLEAEGITATVLGEPLQFLGGYVPVHSNAAPSVWVRNEDETAAADVVRKYESGQGERSCDDVWTCDVCGEMLEAQFTDCWKCGTPRGQTESAQPVMETLTLHVPCVECGYDLHTLPPDGICPECAVPILNSLLAKYDASTLAELNRIEPELMAAIAVARRRYA